MWHATSYNNRPQPVQTLDVLDNASTKLLRTQCFYWGSTVNLQTCTAPNNTDNNGNLRATMLGYGTSANFNETYSYGGMSRLTGVVDSGGWSRYFGHDQHGNMWVPSTTGIPLQGGTVATVNNYAPGTNRINGAFYDAAAINGQQLDLRCEEPPHERHAERHREHVLFLRWSGPPGARDFDLLTEREHGLQLRPDTWFTVFGSRG